MKSKYFIANYFFIFFLLLLVLNDHIFKTTFSNVLTGKLSDFAGVVVLYLLLLYIFPKFKKSLAALVVVLFFTFWKSAYAQGFIYFYNNISPIKITRVVDYTDLFALLILPFIYFLSVNKNFFYKVRIEKINTVLVLLPTIFALMATSPPRYYTYGPYSGDVQFGNDYNHVTLNLSKEQILDELKKRSIVVAKDTNRIIAGSRHSFIGKIDFNKDDLLNNKDSITVYYADAKKDLMERIRDNHQYIIDSVKINNEIIKNIQFDLLSVQNKKTKIYINSIQTEKNLTPAEIDRKLKKYYRNIVKANLFSL